MSLADAFAGHDAKHKAAVIANAWGHLAPAPRKVYSGSIVFATGCFGDDTIINYEFGGLSDSPWLYDDLWEFVGSKLSILRKSSKHNIFKFTGTYYKCKNGRPIFKGKIVGVKV